MAPVQMIHSGHKHRVARTLPRILACELQVLSTGWVVGISHECTLELVRIARQVDSALSSGQCGSRQAAPVAVKVNALVVGVSEGQSSIQIVLCCPVVGTPAGSAHGLGTGHCMPACLALKSLESATCGGRSTTGVTDCQGRQASQTAEHDACTFDLILPTVRTSSSAAR